MRHCPSSAGHAAGSGHRSASTVGDLVRTARSRQPATYAVPASKASACLPAGLGHLGHHDNSSAQGPGRVDDGIEDWAALGEGRHECPGPPTWFSVYAKDGRRRELAPGIGHLPPRGPGGPRQPAPASLADARPRGLAVLAPGRAALLALDDRGRNSLLGTSAFWQMRRGP